MKIENLKSEKNGDRARVVATVSWEDCDRPMQEIYFETDEEFASDISCNSHAFLVACIMPAMHYGEERLFIDAAICPELREGLLTAMGWMRHWWYEPEYKLVRIEAKKQHNVATSAKPPRAGLFFSGGIDSLATLRANRLHYPLQHPGSLKDGLLVYGLEVRDLKNFEHVVTSVSALAQDSAITLIPVYTNIRKLGPDNFMDFWGKFWINEFMGATFSAIAHAFTKRLSVVSINSAYDIPNQIRHGSHPIIDPNYSSSDLRIRHEGITLSRFEKTKLVADWDVALQHLRVCNKIEYYRPGILNCGECEKCVRTMLALLALGVLERSGAFPKNNVSEELVLRCANITPDLQAYYNEMIPPLLKGGRSDLVHAINQGIARYYKRKWKKRWKSRMINPVVEFDRRYLSGKLKQIKQLMFTHETK